MSLNTILATAPLTATGYHLKATGSALGQSLIWDNGTNVGIGNQGTTYTLDVTGTGRFTSTLLVSGASTFSSAITLSTASTSYGSVFSIANTSNSKQWNFTTVGSGIAGRTGNLEINNNVADIFAITQAGNVGIGTTAPTSSTNYTSLVINGTTGSEFNLRGGGVDYGYMYANSNLVVLATQTAIPLVFQTNATERMRITSGGYTKISNSGTYEYVNAAVHEIRQTAADFILYATNNNASPNGHYISYTTASPNGNGNNFITCGDSTAARFRVASNGNCYNVTGTYTSGVSDIRYKEQIVDANSQWNDIKNLRVVNFKFIKDVEENGDNALRHIGFIAQEVEKTSPNLIEEMSDEKTGETWKTIKASIIHTKAIKALQEAMARIETLESTIQNLQEQINILAK